MNETIRTGSRIETREPVPKRPGLEQFRPASPGGKERDLREWLIHECSQPWLRQNLLANIDSKTTAESDTVKGRQLIFTDMFIIGTGPHATAFAQEISHSRPGIRVLFGEKESVRGGQFRAVREPYLLNSTNKAKTGFDPGDGTGEPNDIGSHAVLQMKDISSAEYPSGSDLGTVTAINNFHSAPALVDTRILSVERNTSSEPGLYIIHAFDTKTKKPLTVCANVIVGSSGLGEPDTPLVSVQDERMMTSAAFLTALRGPDAWKIRYLLAGGVSIIGGGDSALVTLEKLAELRKKYGFAIGQVNMYGVTFNTAEEFEKHTADRYLHLSKFFPSGNKHSVWYDLSVRPVPDRIKHVSATDMETTDGKRIAKPYGLILTATGYTNNAADMFTAFEHAETLREVTDNERKRVIARQVPDENIFLVGPAADIPYSNEELTRIPENMRQRYRNSLRRLIPRTEQLAGQLGGFYTARQIFTGTSPPPSKV